MGEFIMCAFKVGLVVVLLIFVVFVIYVQ